MRTNLKTIAIMIGALLLAGCMRPPPTRPTSAGPTPTARIDFAIQQVQTVMKRFQTKPGDVLFEKSMGGGAMSHTIRYVTAFTTNLKKEEFATYMQAFNCLQGVSGGSKDPLAIVATEDDRLKLVGQPLTVLPLLFGCKSVGVGMDLYFFDLSQSPNSYAFEHKPLTESLIMITTLDDY